MRKEILKLINNCKAADGCTWFIISSELRNDIYSSLKQKFPIETTNLLLHEISLWYDNPRELVIQIRSLNIYMNIGLLNGKPAIDYSNQPHRRLGYWI